MTGGILTDETLQPRALFGGAVELHLPPSFDDVSDSIPIPDHQEVFADSREDKALIVEINEHTDIGNAECGAFYFRNLAEDGEATACSITSTSALDGHDLPGISPWHYGCIVEGQQTVSKGRQGPESANEVHVLMAVLRLPQHATDILVVLNSPTFIHPSSTSAAAAGSGPKPQPPGTAPSFRRLLATFRIVDGSLFGGAS